MTVTLKRSVEEFIATPRQLFINGQWANAASGKTFNTPNPATGETLARVAEGDAEDIGRAVRAARAAFEDGPWSRMTPSERGRTIWRVGDLILVHTQELAQLESLDNGKPVAVAAAADVPLAADLFHYMAGWATKIEGNTIDISVATTCSTRPCRSAVQAVRLGPGNGPRGARGLHRGEGRHHPALNRRQAPASTPTQARTEQACSWVAFRARVSVLAIDC
jgi:hypothetical protein